MFLGWLGIVLGRLHGFSMISAARFSGGGWFSSSVRDSFLIHVMSR